MWATQARCGDRRRPRTRWRRPCLHACTNKSLAMDPLAGRRTFVRQTLWIRRSSPTRCTMGFVPALTRVERPCKRFRRLPPVLGRVGNRAGHRVPIGFRISPRRSWINGSDPARHGGGHGQPQSEGPGPSARIRYHHPAGMSVDVDCRRATLGPCTPACLSGSSTEEQVTNSGEKRQIPAGGPAFQRSSQQLLEYDDGA